MKRVTIFLSALLFLVSLTTNTLAASTEVKLLASDSAENTYFGDSVSISGDYAIVGAVWADGVVARTGAAYIYYFDGVNWIEQQKLIASDGAAYDYFGASVSISGNYAFVGAHEADGEYELFGAVYIYYFDGTNWVEQQKLVNNNATRYVNRHFGRSISVSGNYAIICEPNAVGPTENAGVAFIYNFDGTNWVEQQQLTTSDGGEGFCWDGVDISGNQAIVGAKQDDVNGPESGSAYVFSFDGTSWSEQQKLLPSDAYERDWFGKAISISGNYAVITKPEPRSYALGHAPGSAYVFHYDGTNWSEQQKLTAYDGVLRDGFGDSAAMSGDHVIVGTYNHEFNTAYSFGAAYIFLNDGTNWLLAEKLVASDAALYDRFGESVSISNNKAIVGAKYNQDNGGETGSAYIYTDFPTERAEIDQDNDGYVLDVDCNDIDASVNPGEPEVCNDGKDTDCDGLADINDPDCPPDVDVDNDGYGSIYDCNDNNASVNPGASEDSYELCSDGEDNNCNDLTDINEPACQVDWDLDGYVLAEDCVDDAPYVNPGASEDYFGVCHDTLDNDCDGLMDLMDPGCLIDNDGDGFYLDSDCNDSDASVNPGLEEDCYDGKDNDCNHYIDAQDPSCPNDDDGDGYDITVDCNDNDASVNPGATEVCDDGIDNDCNSLIDAYDPVCPWTCADNMDRGTCNDDPNCEWVGSPKNGTCQDVVVCVPDQTPEATCTDGIDNDCDGMTDCADTADCGADPACQGSCNTYTDEGTCTGDPNCEWSGNRKNGTCQDAVVCVPDETPEATCTDGVDNDCDGMTDCADTADCGADPACQGGSCDTYTDKGTCTGDPNCEWSGSPKNGTCQDAVSCVPDETPEATCYDGIDNDCDGLTDCYDHDDCTGALGCVAGSCANNHLYNKQMCEGDPNCEWNNTDGYCQECAGGCCYPDKLNCEYYGCTWNDTDSVCM